MHGEKGDPATFTAVQVATAADALRGAAGLEPERFPRGQVVGMLSDEIRLLRERGLSDEDIAAVMRGAGMEIDGGAVAAAYVDTSEMPRGR